MSIKTKLVFLINLFIGVLLILLSIGTHFYFKNVFKASIYKQQFNMISEKARDLDLQLSNLHNLIISYAKVAPPEIITDHNVAQKWINERIGIQSFFDHSIVLVDTKGLVIAAIPNIPYENGETYSFADYFTKTINSGQPVISNPYKSNNYGHPIITMTAPIKNNNNEIIGALCGSIDLIDTHGIFGALRQIKLGNNGYMYLFAKDRTMILHPDTSRILQKDVKFGANKLFDEAINGFEGSGETVNSKGLPFIASFKQLTSTDWILAANYPQDEAYEPILIYRNYYILAIIIILIGATFVLSKLIYRYLRATENYINQINSFIDSGSFTKKIDIVDNDEIGKIAISFNKLMSEIENKDIEQNQLVEKLMESNKIIEENLFENNLLIEELTQTKEKLEVINAEKDKFFSIIAHDLKSPFSGFLGLTKIMSTEYAELSPDEIKEYSTSLMNSANSLYKLLGNLLEWSRLKRDAIDINMTVFSLKDIVAKVVEYHNLSAKQKQISIINNISDPNFIFADVEFVNLILRNIISNALKFTPRESKIEIGTLEITSDKVDSSKFSTIYVRDYGIGISEDNVQKLFRIDQKLTRAGTENEPGTGLGLLLCKEFVEKIGGRIWVESIVNEGSTFYISFQKAN